MSASILSLVIFTTMLATSIAYPGTVKPLIKEKEKVLMAVEGMVYCQSCAQAGSWSLAGASPLSAAKVGISCKDRKNRVTFYKSIKADTSGYFYCPLEGLDLKKYYKGEFIHACAVRLLSSPNGECNLLTNINGGIEGCAVKDLNKTVAGEGFKAVVYSAPPLAFRPGHCAPLEHF